MRCLEYIWHCTVYSSSHSSRIGLCVVTLKEVLCLFVDRQCPDHEYQCSTLSFAGSLTDTHTNKYNSVLDRLLCTRVRGLDRCECCCMPNILNPFMKFRRSNMVTFISLHAIRVVANSAMEFRKKRKVVEISVAASQLLLELRHTHTNIFFSTEKWDIGFHRGRPSLMSPST